MDEQELQMAKKRQRRIRPARSTEQSEPLHAALRLHQLGQLARAEKAYQQALRHDPENALAHHLLGRLYFQTERKDAAIECLQRAIALRPEYPEALLDLGNMLHEIGQLSQAKVCLQQLIQLRPDDAMAYNNLGVVCLAQQQHEEALAAYRRSLELDAPNPETLCNLGHALSCTEDLEGALQVYRKVLSIDPSNTEAHRCLASLLRRTGRQAEAIDVLASWLKLEPDNPVAQHLWSASTNQVIPQRASDAYVREVFDTFAATFDADLERLNYRGPALIQAGLACAWGNVACSLNVLDAGCGTGLCGPALRPYAQRLVGVDISRRMLAAAEKCNLYDALIESELGAYLSNHPATYDLIASADTLGYFGDLMPLLDLTYTALRPGGTFLATVEVGEVAREPGYQLNSSGRYSHNRNYVSACCESAGFSIERLVDDTLRMEADRAVPVVVLTVKKEH